MNHSHSSTTKTDRRSPNPWIPNGTTVAPRIAKKRTHRALQPITPEILTILLNKITSPRDRALLLILIESGLRMGEITRLDRSTIQAVINMSLDGTDVQLGTGTVLISPGRYRTFWVGSDSVSAVIDYLAKERADDDEAALFVTKHGKRITTSAINLDIAKWCKSAGVERIGCYRFRHTLGSNLANAGISMPALAKLLGYSNPKGGMRDFTKSSHHPSPGVYRRLLFSSNKK